MLCQRAGGTRSQRVRKAEELRCSGLSRAAHPTSPRALALPASAPTFPRPGAVPEAPGEARTRESTALFRVGQVRPFL